MDRTRPFEKVYNKPAKSQSGIIGISCRKEAVAKWNIIRQDKSNFATFLYEPCSLDEEDEYFFHHKFSKAITDTDTHCICLAIDYTTNRRNPFKFSDNNDLANIDIYSCINENQYHAFVCVELKKFIDLVKEEQSKYPSTESFMFRFIRLISITFI